MGVLRFDERGGKTKVAGFAAAVVGGAWAVLAAGDGSKQSLMRVAFVLCAMTLHALGWLVATSQSHVDVLPGGSARRGGAPPTTVPHPGGPTRARLGFARVRYIDAPQPLRPVSQRFADCRVRQAFRPG